MLEGKKILVLGGAGFVGSNLICALVKSNEVVSLDCYFSGTEDNHIANVKYINGYSRDIKRLLGNQFFDYIFHFGEYSRVESSFDDYLTVMDFNLGGFPFVVEYAGEHCGKFIYSGSSTKFGDIAGGKEASPYAWSKSTNTQHLIRYADWFGLDYCITYFYNVYGDNEISDGKYSTVIGKYLNLVSKGESELPVTRPGTQVRNFTHIEDVVSALLLVAEFGHGDGYGIGSNVSYTILDVVEMLGKRPFYLPESRGNRMTAELYTEKTKALGWSPEISLPEYFAKKLSEVVT